MNNTVILEQRTDPGDGLHLVTEGILVVTRVAQIPGICALWLLNLLWCLQVFIRT